MLTTSCPDKARLRDCLHGRLPEDESGPLLEHLQACPSCEAVAKEVESAGDYLTKHLCASDEFEPGDDSPPSWISQVKSSIPQIEANGDILSTESTTDELPSTLGAYDVQEIIGRGGMGIVYRAIHQRLGKPVAVKLIAARSTPDAAARFEREMRAVGQLEHPSIVRATDAGTVDGCPFLAMELIDGVDLRQLLKRCGLLRVADACEIARQAAIGLQAAHDAGVVHRDMKPSNLMLTREGQVKILDFGLASTEAVADGITHATSVGQLLGTLDYLAPEQIDGCQVDGRADVYALGTTLFALLAGRTPLAKEPDAPLLVRLRRLALEELPRLSDFRPDVPPQLDELVEQMLARDPELRVESAGEVARQLTELADGHDLRGLAQQGLSEASADTVPSPYETVMPADVAASPGAPDLRSHTSPKAVTRPTVSHTWKSRLMLALLALLLLSGGAWLSVTILLETQEGTLRIESEVADVRVELLDERDRTRELKIERGANETVLRAGQYRLRLAGEHDALSVSPGEITLRRGEEEVARITRLEVPMIDRPAPADVLPADVLPAEPLFQGKPESVWRRRLEAEQSPVAKIEAAQALITLAGHLPPERRIDRMLEIGASLVEAGWGEDAYRLAIDRLGRSTPGLSATRWAATEEQFEAWRQFTRLIQNQRLQIPPAVRADRLGEAVGDDEHAVSAFAAWMLTVPMPADSHIRQDPDAVRILVERLDVKDDDFERVAVAQLLRASLYDVAGEEDGEKITAGMHQLSELLLTTPQRRHYSQILVAWLIWAPRIPVDAEVAAEMVYLRLAVFPRGALNDVFEARWFSDELPYTSLAPDKLREQAAFFLPEWISVANQRLADEATGDEQFEAIVQSLDYVLRARLPDDRWDVDTTARLLTERLRSAWTADDPHLTGDAMHQLLTNVVRIEGSIPDFVRNTPAGAEEQLEAWDQLFSSQREYGQLVREGRRLPPVMHVAPYQSVQLALGSAHFLPGHVHPREVLLLLAGEQEPPIDPLLLLAILADLSGQDEKHDRQIAKILAEPHPSRTMARHVRDILSGRTALRPIARDLLAQIWNQATVDELREAVLQLDQTIGDPSR